MPFRPGPPGRIRHIVANPKVKKFYSFNWCELATTTKILRLPKKGETKEHVGRNVAAKYSKEVKSLEKGNLKYITDQNELGRMRDSNRHLHKDDIADFLETNDGKILGESEEFMEIFKRTGMVRLAGKDNNIVLVIPDWEDLERALELYLELVEEGDVITPKTVLGLSKIFCINRTVINNDLICDADEYQRELLDSILYYQNDLKKNNEEVAALVEKVTNDVTGLANDVTGLAKDVTGLANDVTATEASISQLEAKYEKLNEKIAMFDPDTDGLPKDDVQKYKETQELRATLEKNMQDNIMNKMNETKQKWQQEIMANVDRKFADLSATLPEMINAAVQKEVGGLKQQVGALEGQVGALEGQVQKQGEDIEEAKEDIEFLMVVQDGHHKWLQELEEGKIEATEIVKRYDDELKEFKTFLNVHFHGLAEHGSLHKHVEALSFKVTTAADVQELMNSNTNGPLDDIHVLHELRTKFGGGDVLEYCKKNFQELMHRIEDTEKTNKIISAEMEKLHKEGIELREDAVRAENEAKKKRVDSETKLALLEKKLDEQSLSINDILKALDEATTLSHKHQQKLDLLSELSKQGITSKHIGLMIEDDELPDLHELEEKLVELKKKADSCHHADSTDDKKVEELNEIRETTAIEVNSWNGGFLSGFLGLDASHTPLN